jgi:hypothetical protein
MRTALEKTLRGKLEKTVEKARDIVEVAVTEALTRLGISEGSSPSYLSETERKLRTRLRAHGRQLGDILHKETTTLVKANDQETELLINEIAYEHWHRMLFARFLEQSDLLMYEPGTPVTLDECSELAEDEADCKDGWELAGRLAEKMLPQIFRTDSPVFEVKLSINHVNALEDLIAALHPDTFQASDALGWCYQFWQNKKKKQVNESGVKIGAKELSPVTQLFTEPYMVSFLLDNALGAWWAKRRLTKDDLLTATNEQELRELAAIPGVPLEYLRFVQDEETKKWSNAAGDFDKWPEDLSELKTLDPCCGSGHFLVAKFLMLVPMRMELEALTAKQAIDRVIAENIHGLELDQRCVELAAFALALEAWRYPGAGGYRQLPELQLACSGMSINEAQKEWKDLAKGDEKLQGAIKWMQETFKNAPTLGSLIDPTKNLDETNSKPWELIQQAVISQADVGIETITTAQGLAKAASILNGQYHVVSTNVPYLALGKFSEKLKVFVETYFYDSRHDLASCFIERCNGLVSQGGRSLIVSPQNWIFLKRYSDFRKKLLSQFKWSLICKLGAGAFDGISGEVVQVSLTLFQKTKPTNDFIAQSLEAEKHKKIVGKINHLKNCSFQNFDQRKQLQNDAYSIRFQDIGDTPLVSEVGDAITGVLSGDLNRFVNKTWEVEAVNYQWELLQSSVKNTKMFSGLSDIYFLEKEKGDLARFAASVKHLNHAAQNWLRGKNQWGKKGVAISKMGELKSALYNGAVYSENCCAIIPDKEEHIPALWAYCLSGEYSAEVRKINQSLLVQTKYMINVPFDVEKWTLIAQEKYPNGLPEPHTNDSTQWLFHGHPCASVTWNEATKTTTISELRQDDTVLQVAVARLLGYRWPAELDTEMELAPEMREVIAQNKVFDDLVDDDGIVCIPAIRGEKPAVDRLETILHAAYGDKWSATILNNLLKSVKSRDLNLWLRDKFFEQHSKLFQHRPFIWQVWDGLPDGFSALVNYHTLDYKGLERLIYTYLDDWISTQIQQEKDGDEGAELRLTAARNLREQLEAILVGESNGKEGLDIFVRWKSLAEQPIGWNPDLNDGVRLNIRPFMQAKDVGKKGAGVLRTAPNIHWKKDRGTDVESAPWYDLGLKYGGKQGDRINDHHLTLAEKKSARDAKND